MVIISVVITSERKFDDLLLSTYSYIKEIPMPQECTKVKVLFDRPIEVRDDREHRIVEIPKDWIIYNAPRPIYGHYSWIGDFIHGVFYTATPSVDEKSKKLNASQDAYIIEYCTIADVKEYVEKVLSVEYPGEVENMDFEEYKEFYIGSFLNFHNKRNY
jgi:hypothetical protein